MTREATSRKTGRGGAVVAALMALTTLLGIGIGIATPANASTVTPMACQSWARRAEITFTSHPSTAYTCSGSHTPRNEPVVKFSAGNWSGYFMWGSQRVEFCNWEVYDFGGDIYLPISTLYLSETKAPWC